ncbi:MAG: DUF58 domain-containing protein [Brevinema sp.]
MPQDNVGDISIADIVAQTKYLEITARKLVSETLQSDYKSSFRGRGMEFDEVRSYSFGDDVRDIDWNVTARMNEPFIKTFIEERRLTTFFLVDVSSSHNFGTAASKRSVMAEITALLGFTSFFANDNTGLILFSDDIVKVVPATHSHPHLLRIIRDVYFHQAESQKTNLNQALRAASAMLKKKAVIFVISDFFDQNYSQAMGILSRRHELIPIVIRDKGEEKNPITSVFPIITELEDLETGETQFVSLNRDKLAHMRPYIEEYRSTFKKLGLHYAEIFTGSPILPAIKKILKRQGGRN